MTLVACGGGDQASTSEPVATGGQTTVASQTPATTSASPTTVAEPSGSGPTGTNSIGYTISGGYEAAGEAQFVPSLSFFDSGIWSLTFADETAGIQLTVYLDPSTPSANLTDVEAGVVASGDSSQCDFQTTQDANGASGSFTCSNIPVVVGGALTEADSFSGTFDVKP